MFFGLHVAETVGKGIVDASIVTPAVIFATLVGAIVWNIVTWIAGIPSSSSHTLIGGLVGAGVAKDGVCAISGRAWQDRRRDRHVAATGFVLALLLILVVFWLFVRQTPFAVDSTFRVMQFFSASLHSLGHGGNDAQKTIGIIALLLYSQDMLGATFYVPLSVVLTCSRQWR